MATHTTQIDFDEGAAPATPAAADVRLYAKADGLLYSKDDAGNETLVSSGASAAPTLARKTADEAFSTTTLNNSAGLSFAVAANTNYKFRFVVFFSCNSSTVGIRIGFNLPTGATIRWGMILPVADSLGSGNAIMTGSTNGVDAAFSTLGGTGAAQIAIFEGIAVIGGTAGTLQLRHGSETATATTILANSFGELTVIA